MAKKPKSDLHQAAVQLGRKGGKKGGPARDAALSEKRKTEIAKQGGRARQRLA